LPLPVCSIKSAGVVLVAVKLAAPEYVWLPDTVKLPWTVRLPLPVMSLAVTLPFSSTLKSPEVMFNVFDTRLVGKDTVWPVE